MYNHTLVTEKRYVEFDGLRALIDKIGALRAEYIGRFEEGEGATADLLTRVNAIINGAGNANDPLTAENYTIAADNILQQLLTAIDDIRTELGAEGAGKADTTVYSRLDLLEEQVQAEVTGLLARTKKLEDESFAKVEVNDAASISETNNIHVVFKNAADTEVGHFDIDTTEFVVDGMLGDIKLVSVVVPGSEVIDLKDGSNITDATILVESQQKTPGERYFVFTFKTTEVGDATNGFTGEATGLRNIWVSVKDLHDSYVFKAENDADPSEYVELSVAAPVHSANGETVITYSVKLTDKSTKGIDLANGDYVRVLENGTNDPIRGVEKLHDDLKAAEADIDKLQEEVEAETTGLLDRMTVAEADIDKLEEEMGLTHDWIEGAFVPASEIEAYFDFVVYANNANAKAARAKADTDTKSKLGQEDNDNPGYFAWADPNNEPELVKP